MGRFNNVTIGDTYMQDEGFALASKTIGFPTVKTKSVSIPLRDGDLDLTDVLSNRPHYGNRELTLNMNSISRPKIAKMTELANLIHGQKAKIIFDDDLAYYYYGRLTLDKFKEYKLGGEYTVKADCDPFKYTIQDSADDWLWDPFDFDEGYINDLGSLTVDGTLSVTLIADEQLTYATITTDAAVTVTYNGTTVSCPIGSTTLYDFEFERGDNVITITGQATVSISYRGGKI